MTAREFVLSSFDWRDSRFARDKGAQAFAEAYSQAENERLQKEVADLKSWKESAISVMPSYQEIGKELGLHLGDSIHDKILPGIRKLKAALRSEQRKDGKNG